MRAKAGAWRGDARSGNSDLRFTGRMLQAALDGVRFSPGTFGPIAMPVGEAS